MTATQHRPVPAEESVGHIQHGHRVDCWLRIVQGTGLVQVRPHADGTAVTVATVQAGDVVVPATGHQLFLEPVGALTAAPERLHVLDTAPDAERVAATGRVDRWLLQLAMTAGAAPGTDQGDGDARPVPDGGDPHDAQTAHRAAEARTDLLVAAVIAAHGLAAESRRRRLELHLQDRAPLDRSSIDTVAAALPGLDRSNQIAHDDVDAAVLGLIGFPVPRSAEPSVPVAPETADEAAQHLLRRAQSAGHVVRIVDLGHQVRRDLAAPLAAFYELRPVALLPTGRGVRFIDPASGADRRLTAADLGHLASIGVTGVRELPRHTGLRDLVRLAMSGLRVDVARLVVLLVIAGLAALLLPLAGGAIFGTIVPNRQYQRLVALVIALFAVIVATAAIDIAAGRLAGRLRTQVDAAAGDAVWSRLLRLPASFFSRYTSGELLSRASAVDTLRLLVDDSLLASFIAVGSGMVSLALVFWQGWMAGLLTVAVIAVQLVVVTVIFRQRRPLLARQVQEQADVQSHTLQTMRAMSRLRAFAAEDRAMQQLARRFAVSLATGYQDSRRTAVLTVVMTAWPTLGTLAIAAGVVMAGGGGIGLAGFVTLTTALGQVLAGMSALTSVAAQLIAVRPYLEQLTPILAEEPEADAADAERIAVAGALEVSHVDFRYTAEGADVLQNVTFAVRPGEFVAVVGPSGSGKSTLLRLLLGFDAPGRGIVSYDGHDLAGLDVRHVRSQIGTVLQNAALLPGSLADNIRGGRSLNMDAVWRAAAAAAVAADIERMPMQMQTVVVEGANTLSGGQRQRVVIARALAARPRILLLDEATSALDNVTQAEVAESLAGLSCTRLVIAHRLSTIRDADRIIVLDAGRIVETGTYDDLLARNGVFAALAHRQLVDQSLLN